MKKSELKKIIKEVVNEEHCNNKKLYERTFPHVHSSFEVKFILDNDLPEYTVGHVELVLPNALSHAHTDSYKDAEELYDKLLKMCKKEIRKFKGTK